MHIKLNSEDIVGEIVVDTAKQFYNEIIYNEEYYGYLYRGHGKADTYKLIPGLLRNLENRRKLKRCEFYIEELRSLLLFYHEANKHGLYVPIVPEFFKHGLVNKTDLSLIIKENDWRWLSDDIIELVSLAQHYGLKTRVLDWTRDIRVALYFACMEEINDEDMAIWCIDAEYLESIRVNENSGEMLANIISYKGDGDHLEKKYLIQALRQENLPLRFWVPKYFDNENMNAQCGVLSMWQYNLPGQKYSNVPNDIAQLRNKVSENIKTFLDKPITEDSVSLDKLLLNYFNETSKMISKIRGINKKVMRKIVIKRECQNDLLKLLQRDGYDEARIYPGYKSVINVVKKICGEQF